MLEQCAISSSILLSSPPQKLCRCPTGKSLTTIPRYPMRYQMITCLLGRGCLTRNRFRQLCEVIYYNQYLVLSRLRHADFLMVYLHHFNELRALDRLEGKLHLPWVFYLEACQAGIHPSLASFSHSWPIKPVKYPLLYFIYPLVSHLVVRSEKHLRLIQLW